jgi:hypothetical protein
MTCYQSTNLPRGFPATGRTSYRTEAECNQACGDGACCEGTTCTVKPQCQCQCTSGSCCGPDTFTNATNETGPKCRDESQSDCLARGGVWRCGVPCRQPSSDPAAGPGLGSGICGSLDPPASIAPVFKGVGMTCSPNPCVCRFSVSSVGGVQAIRRDVTFDTLFGSQTLPLVATSQAATYRAGGSIPVPLADDSVYQGSDIVNWFSGFGYTFKCLSGVWTLEFYREEQTYRWQTQNVNFVDVSRYVRYDTSVFYGSVIVPTDTDGLPTAGSYTLSSAANYSTLCDRGASPQGSRPFWTRTLSAQCPNGVDLPVPSSALTIGVW